MANSSVRQHLLVACVAAVWGTLGRLALDWYLPIAGFNESPEQPALSFLVGPLPVWTAVGVIVWTPLTAPLRKASPGRSLALGAAAAIAGTLILYGSFVFQTGLPTSLVQAMNVCLFFPLFLGTALVMGGMIAIPATVGTALLLRSLLHASDADRIADRPVT